eukprot:CAMPEP_0184503366 /NCGR_PEP_ID=MMETSP0113_2-20130426/51848_1 /TAXON_ID=91329 /ORGANISM="Norrisiella sphaerica, Strain BC52" /LENGTH=118 /DNA_ID=CAMNT_0026892851 /DNA_START=3065 /DNA_END=3418 /DNA_ORIENTATION=-
MTRKSHSHSNESGKANFPNPNQKEEQISGRGSIAVKENGVGVLLAASGSVAAVKVPEMVQMLVKRGHRVDLVLTDSAAHFLNVAYHGAQGLDQLRELESYKSQSGHQMLKIWRDADEW